MRIYITKSRNFSLFFHKNLPTLLRDGIFDVLGHAVGDFLASPLTKADFLGRAVVQHFLGFVVYDWLVGVRTLAVDGEHGYSAPSWMNQSRGSTQCEYGASQCGHLRLISSVSP